MNIQTSKAWLRTSLRMIRSSMTESERNRKNARIHRSIIHSPIFKKSKSVALFLSFGSEVDTWALLDTCRKKKKIVYIPNCTRGFKHPYFSELKSSDQLKKSKYGPLEFKHTKPRVPFEKIRTVIVPGLGFDPWGARIGFGGGVYDRLMAKTAQSNHIGLFYEIQKCARLPVEKTDRKLKYFCTENGFFCVDKST